MSEAPFARGQYVRKVKGLPFGGGDALVLVCYRMLKNEGSWTIDTDWRVVVQHPEGWQHIFSPDQLEVVR
jgi:hypothetical protein